MDERMLRLTEIVNRLKRGTTEGKVLWRSTSQGPREYAADLADGANAEIAVALVGGPVLLTIRNAGGVVTMQLDSSRACEDHLQLALLQLFVVIRDTVEDRATEQALNAVRDL